MTSHCHELNFNQKLYLPYLYLLLKLSLFEDNDLVYTPHSVSRADN